MLVSTMESVPGRRVTEVLGIVEGTAECEEADSMIFARKEATDMMVQRAKMLATDAILNVRYTSATFARRSVGIMAYGTAVTLEPEE